MVILYPRLAWMKKLENIQLECTKGILCGIIWLFGLNFSEYVRKGTTIEETPTRGIVTLKEVKAVICNNNAKDVSSNDLNEAYGERTQVALTIMNPDEVSDLKYPHIRTIVVCTCIKNPGPGLSTRKLANQPSL
jgi:hypothetical protein